MKKKKIEKVGLIAPDIEQSRKAYLAAAQVIKIDDVDHLIIDIYRRERRTRTPKMRAAYTAHDWGLLDWYGEKWSGASISDESYRSKPRYDEFDMIQGPGMPKGASWSNTDISPESVSIIHEFAEKNGSIAYNPDLKWWKDLIGLEKEIRIEKETKAFANREERLKKRCEDMPELPEGLAEWADRVIFKNKECIYYKRHGRYADCQCSKCGAEYRILNKRSQGIEGMLEDVWPVPRQTEQTECKICGAKATYRARGRMKFTYGEKNKAYVIQPFRETETVIRYLEMRKEWSLGGPSRVYCVEIGRRFIHGRREKTDWNLVDNWTGQRGWYDRNVGGMANIGMNKAPLYIGNADEWTQRIKYSGIREYAAAKGEIKPTYYLAATNKFDIEKLVKVGMFNIVERLVGGLEQEFRQSNTLEGTLGIRRARLKMCEEYDSVDLMKVLQIEKWNTRKVMQGKAKGKGEWTEEQIMKAWSMNLTRNEAQIVFKWMSVTQLINRIEKYIDRPVQQFPGKMDPKAGQTMRLYCDYLRMRDENGFDMERDTSIYPKDIWKAHRDVVAIVNQKENDRRTPELEKKFPKIKKKYRKLRRKYFYKADGLMIRPAKDAREILEEGQTLHHCVGAGETYYRRHNDGQSAILFLRFATDPNTPYITVEIEDYEIRQWYGRNDTKPDKDKINAWLNKWLIEIQGGAVEDTADQAHEKAMQNIMAAG